MSARLACLALLLATADGETLHGNRRERRQAGGSCVNTEGRPGSCLGLRSCPPLEQLLFEAKRGGSGARGALNKLRQETLRCPFSRANPLVCCETGSDSLQRQTPRPQVFTARPTQGPLIFGSATRRPTRRTTRRPQRFSNTRRPQRFSTTPTRRTTQRSQTNGGGPSGLTSGQATLPGEDLCGRRAFSSRIFGGKDAEIGSWPWAASIGYRQNGRGSMRWSCGATLITAQYVVTAGHCVTGRSLGSYRPQVVRLGELDFNTEPDCLKDDPTECAERHQDISIARTVPHPQYEGRANLFANDIALIRLARSISFSEFVRPICLPLDLSRLGGGSDSTSGRKVYAVGWGRSSGGQAFTPVLQEVELRLMPGSECVRTFRRNGLSSLGSRLCVGSDKPGSDTCSGDSGGPLMATDKFGFNWYLTGITSFGATQCGEKPAVYTRVHDYVDWIRSNIG